MNSYPPTGAAESRQFFDDERGYEVLLWINAYQYAESLKFASWHNDTLNIPNEHGRNEVAKHGDLIVRENRGHKVLRQASN